MWKTWGEAVCFVVEGCHCIESSCGVSLLRYRCHAWCFSYGVNLYLYTSAEILIYILTWLLGYGHLQYISVMMGTAGTIYLYKSVLLLIQKKKNDTHRIYMYSIHIRRTVFFFIVDKISIIYWYLGIRYTWKKNYSVLSARS